VLLAGCCSLGAEDVPDTLAFPEFAPLFTRMDASRGPQTLLLLLLLPIK